MPRRAVDPSDRFWAKVAITPGCWLWQAGTWQAFGYGKFQAGTSRETSRAVYAHRWAWEQQNGPIPAGLILCHRCDEPRCVRPDHLFLGTQLDNIRDMHAKGRQARPDIERPIPRGTGHGNAVLTDDTVREIRRLAPAYPVVMDLASHLGLNHHTVRDVLRGRTWRHID